MPHHHIEEDSGGRRCFRLSEDDLQLDRPRVGVNWRFVKKQNVDNKINTLQINVCAEQLRTLSQLKRDRL